MKTTEYARSADLFVDCCDVVSDLRVGTVFDCEEIAGKLPKNASPYAVGLKLGRVPGVKVVRYRPPRRFKKIRNNQRVNA